MTYILFFSYCWDWMFGLWNMTGKIREKGNMEVHKYRWFLFQGIFLIFFCLVLSTWNYLRCLLTIPDHCQGGLPDLIVARHVVVLWPGKIFLGMKWMNSRMQLLDCVDTSKEEKLKRELCRRCATLFKRVAQLLHNSRFYVSSSLDWDAKTTIERKHWIDSMY